MQVETDISITPRMMAEAFWNMTDLEQVEFFAELHDVINKDKTPGACTWSCGEMQWLYMADALNKNLKAKEMACAIMANVFLHSTNFMENK